jgi:hypothetical protein
LETVWQVVLTARDKKVAHVAMNLLIDLQMNLVGRLSQRKNRIWEEFVNQTMDMISTSYSADQANVDRLLQVLLHFLNKYEGTSDNLVETVSSSVNYYVYTW